MGITAKSLVGQRFGKLVVIAYHSPSYWSPKWSCQCDCGQEHIANGANLKRGMASQCKDCANKQRGKHGHASGHTNPGLKSKRSPTYTSWLSMLSRVRQSSKSEKLRYGYAHVSICERWHSYENFLADMGERPEGTTLDRVDNSGNYEPGNCRWADWSTQLKNRRPRRH